MEKYGFVYIWYDRKHKRYYIGSHWGREDDGYICSSRWMRNAYKIRPECFKRRILSRIYTNREDLILMEQYWIDMIDDNKLATKNTTTGKRETVRYYNVTKQVQQIWHQKEDHRKTIGQKISASKKGKKTGPRDPSVGEAISKAKKRSFQKRKEELGYTFTPEHAEKIAFKNRGRKHTEETKAKHAKDMREQWENGIRKSNGSPSEETRDKISKALTGIKRENVENYKIAHSKKYTIIMNDGTQIIANGLKKYGLENNIPYVTLFKAAQHSTRIPKYNIQSINLV